MQHPPAPSHLESPSPPPAPWLRRGLWLALALFFAHQVLYWGLVQPMLIHGVDYGKHWQAARAVLAGASPYIGEDLWVGFNYPQATAFMFLWLGFVSFEVGEKLWKLMLLGTLIGCWLLAWRCFRPRMAAMTGAGLELRRAAAARWWLVTAFAVAAYMPALSAIYIGNIDPVNALLAVAMVAALLAARPRLAGAAWALLMLVKMLPLALLAPLVMWRCWRVLAGALAVLGGYFVLLLATGRLGHEWYLVSEMIGDVPRWWRHISITPARALLELSGHGEIWRDPYGFTLAARVQLALLGTGYLGLILWLRLRGVDRLRALELAMIAYPILTPLLEYHHFVWMLPALLLQLRRWVEGEMNGAVAGVLLAGWLLLQASWTIAHQLGGANQLIQYLSLVAYLIVLAGSVAEVAWMKRAPTGAAGSAA